MSDVRRFVVPGCCVLLGLLVVTIALIVGVDRGTPARAGLVVPTIDIGRVPASHESATATTGGTRRSITDNAVLAPGSRLRIARVGLDAPITGVGAPGGVMHVPLDPHRLGWWRDGAAPGDPHGNTVLVGHVNYGGVAGALAVLPDLRPGDVIAVAEPTTRTRYRVVAVRTYPKAVGLPANVFRRTGAPGLVLITCGGPFDSASGNYDDNIVAYAVPSGHRQ